MERNTLVLALCIFAITFTAFAGDSLFPVVGTSYTLIYQSRPEGEFWPGEVKIIAKGDAQWVLVEFERRTSPLSRKRVISESKPSPEATPTAEPTPNATPTITIHRRWMNFALITAAEQIE